jgi:hypothetical protein
MGMERHRRCCLGREKLCREDARDPRLRGRPTPQLMFGHLCLHRHIDDLPPLGQHPLATGLTHLERID